MGQYLVHLRGFPFLKIGITLSSFESSGKIPVTKDGLMSLGIDILFWNIFWEA